MSTMTPDKIADVDIFAIMADDAEVPCNYLMRGTPCPRPARSAYRCVCGVDHQFCDPHRALIDRRDLNGHTIACSHCHVHLPSPIPWRPL